MAHNVEPMDVDCMDSEFDNKENTFHHSNLLPCTEKGYEELDVSELNMKLRYSITPAASPMSKSYTAYTDNRNLDSDDSLNCTVENNLTRSLNSTITKNDRGNHSLKTLPLQSLPTEFGILRPPDATVTDTNATITLSEVNEIDENLSLPSTSSSLTHTPEATTPVNDVKNDNGSPIMRGLKTVLNMFRPSQSPIPPMEGENTKPELSSLDSTITEEKQSVLASTPIVAHRSKDGNSSRRSSPLKESITFKDDLEKELQWKDETTIFFSQDKIPIHKLFFPNTKSVIENVPYGDTIKHVENNLNSTIEYMDISQNDTITNDRTLSEIQADLATDKNECHATTESDGEFVDCETTFTNESQVQDPNETVPAITYPLLDTTTSEIESIHSITEKHVNDLKSMDVLPNELYSKDTVNPLQEVREDTNSTIAIIQELDSLLEGNNSKKDVTSNESPINSTASDKINEKEDQKDDIPIAAGPPNTNSEISNIQCEETTKQENLLMESVNIHSILPVEQHVVLESQQTEEIPFVYEAKPADMPLPDENDIEKNLRNTDVLETATLLDTNTSDVVEIVQTHMTQISAENVNKTDFTLTENIPMSEESILITDVKINKDEDMTQISAENVNKTDFTLTENIPMSEESILITDVKINKDVLDAIGRTVLEEINKEVDKSENKTLESELKAINETVNDLSVIPDLENQTISNDNDQQELKTLHIQNPEDTQQMGNNIKIPLSIESVPMPDHKQLDLNPTVPSIEQNDSVLTHCDVNSAETIKNKIDDGLKDTTVCISESFNQIDVIQANVSLNTDNANLTVNKELNVTTVNDYTTDVLQNSLTHTNKDEVTKEESMLAENSTENNANSTVLIDNKNDTRADIPVELKMNTSLENDGAAIDTKGDTKFNEIDNATVVESKLDETEQALKDNMPSADTKDNMPSVDTSTTFENKDTTALNDIKKDVEFNEMANSTVVIESKLDKTQENFMDNVPPTDTIVCNEPVNKPAVSDVCESPNTDLEIIVSENNSPYVSVMAGIDTEPKEAKDNFDTVENTFTSTVPSSPPIVSKGYNFNFDEIDNPFATKTKIRVSPPPTTPSKNTELNNTPYTEFDNPKKAPINRRKSQPPERKKTAVNKKKFNTTIDAKLPNKPKTEKETFGPTMDLKPAKQNDNLNDLKPDENQDELTELESKSYDTKEIKDNSETKESVICEANDQCFKLEDVKEKKLEQKSSCESSITNNSDVKTSSSEQSTYFSAVASSTEGFKSKNVFNLPEIDDVNFNPFATKSKMRQSPPPLDLEENPFVTKTKLKDLPDSSMFLTNENTINKVDMDIEDKMDIEQMEKEVDISNATSSSKTGEGRNLTNEINTEDEDTEEGPFLEAEDALDKASVLGDSEFNRLPTNNEDNLETGEMFIDAEAFEFLLNQNKTNIVADSGKESLFLKFDPLFAKRMSSDGVVAALNKVHKKHSTPTKARSSFRNDASPIAGPSNINVTYEANLNASAEESTEDINITVSKPTMIVTPAVNSAMAPRSKSITPNRSNRRSITFTSPAMAVIDRLLSMSANNSLVDTTVTESQNEADLALTQLRELLAEKEIDVYNLKAESIELKERLNTMESQVKLLEADGKERLKKINDLNSQLAEKSKINKSMAAVVEEYERTIASLIDGTEQDKRRHAEERMRLINERDEQTAHLASMEVSFSDLHSKYEKSKQVILNFKANEEAYQKSIKDFEESMTKLQNNYEMLKQHATSKLNHANSELERINKAHEAEVLKLNALLKRNALHITSLEETLAQKTKANDELTAICDELINKVG